MGFPWKQILNVGLNIGTQMFSAISGVTAISLIPQLIVSIENAFFGKPSSGEQKKLVALETALTLISVSEGLSRKDLISNEQFMNALDDMIEVAVRLENAIHWKPIKP